MCRFPVLGLDSCGRWRRIAKAKTASSAWSMYNLVSTSRAQGWKPAENNLVRERIPSARCGEPDGVCGPAMFLAAAGNNYVRGHVQVVDGAVDGPVTMGALKIKSEASCRWGLVSLGEVMLRLDPGDRR